MRAIAEETLTQLPPQDIDAEKGVLGGILLEPDLYISVAEILQPEDFYKTAHQLIFQAMSDLNASDEQIDLLTVKGMLEDRLQLENAGGLDYLTDIAEIGTSALVIDYARRVEDKAILRRLIHASNTINKESYEQTDNVETILDHAESAIMRVSETRNRTGFKAIGDLIEPAINAIEERSKQTSAVTGLPTGYPDLDKITAGLHSDELTIFAARPGMGKTAFALNVAQNIATKQGAVVAIFSLEMGAEQLIDRMLCAEGSIDASHLRSGQLTDSEWKDLVVAMGMLGQSKIFIDDTPGIRMAEIRARSRRLLQEQKKLDLIVIDYLQLIESSRHGENRQQEVSEISRQLKKLAKELHVPVIALSQLSRSVESRQDKRPVLSDIRESGSIEQDADIVGFLYREDYYEREEEESDQDNLIEIIIEKNRNGARGTVKLIFTKEFNKFSSVSFRAE